MRGTTYSRTRSRPVPDDPYSLVESVACETCNAKAGEPCIPTTHGQFVLVLTDAELTSPHLARWQAAREAGVRVRAAAHG